MGLALLCQLILTLVTLAGWDPTYTRDAPSMSKGSPGGPLLPPLGHLALFWGPSSTGRPPSIRCKNLLSGDIINLQCWSTVGVSILGSHLGIDCWQPHQILQLYSFCPVVSVHGQTSIAGCIGSGGHQIPTLDTHPKIQVGIQAPLHLSHCRCPFLRLSPSQQHGISWPALILQIK